jgi:HK97 family phage major capsid protein
MNRPYGSQRAKVSVSQSLLKIAEGFDSDASHKREKDREHMRIFDYALRHGVKLMSRDERARFDRFQAERRDMSDTGGGAYPASANGFFTPALFDQQVWQMMRQTDRLFDPDVVSFVTTDKGGPLSVPMLDDTTSAASVLAQNQQTVQQEPPVLGQLSFGVTPTFQSGLWKVSRSLVEDNAVDIPGLFAATSATRFRRGIGTSLVTTLLNAATLGAVANGTSDTDGVGDGRGAGFGDLHALLQSVDTAYIVSPKCRWLMNFNTYTSLLKIKDRNSRPVIREQYNADGEPMLLGLPVAICPSMPSMSATTSSPQQSVAPIILGDLGRLMVRVVGAMRIAVLDERWAEFFQIGFESFVRADAGLMVTAGSDSPIKYLQTAA